MSKEELVAAESTSDRGTEVPAETADPAGKDKVLAPPDLRLVIDGIKAAALRRERSAQ